MEDYRSGAVLGDRGRAAEKRTNVQGQGIVQPIETKTSDKTGSVTKVYNVWDDEGNKQTLNIIRDADGKLFRMYLEVTNEQGRKQRAELSPGYGEGIGDEYIVKSIAEARDWTLQKPPRAGAITKASYTEEGLVNETDKLRQQILNAAIDEVAHQRMANGLRPLSSHEALVMRADINRMLQQFFKQSTALPKNHPQALITRMTQRPQMRGPKVVVPAKYETVDPRSITKLPFQDQRIAAKQVSDVINNKINQYAEQGSREATNLWFKPSTEPHRRATPEQLQHLLDTAQLSKEQRETLENWLNQAKRPEAQLLDDIEQVQIGRAHV